MRRFLQWFLLAVLGGVAGHSLGSEPIRLSVPAFGTSAEIEVRDLPRAEAEAAVREALTEIYTLHQLFDPLGTIPGGIGQLNGASGLGPQPVDRRVGELLRRGLQFCAWSDGAYGPLAGELRQLWRVKDKTPNPGDLRIAVIRADCPRLTLEETEGTFLASLIDGSRVDAGGMAQGFAIDRAFEILETHGAKNLWIEIGDIWRCQGEGADGKGWLASLPPVPHDDSKEPLDQLWLDQHAMAVLPEGFDLDSPTLVDQRTGVPPSGVVGVVTVSELAVDAAGLAEALFIIGLREGQMRLGALKPRPSAYWLLGDGIGKPLESAFRWSELRRVKRR